KPARVAMGQGADGPATSSRWCRPAPCVQWFSGLRPVYRIAPVAPRVAEADEVTHAWARGTQAYVCVAGEGGALSWKFVGPRARLFDDDGRRVGTHCAD